LSACCCTTVNAAGVNDMFSFVFEFVIDENSPGTLRGGAVPFARGTAEPSDVPPAATIFTALEEQLGLRLEPAKAERQYIVIDHVERLSPN
jgi:uncharacterized protein (TIGR03435 family)